jgi:hypothetical protein
MANDLILGGNGSNSTVTLVNADNEPLVRLVVDKQATIQAGRIGPTITPGHPGQLLLAGEDQQVTIKLEGTSARLELGTHGGKGPAGCLSLTDGQGHVTAYLLANGARLVLGGNGTAGQCALASADGKAFLRLQQASNEGQIVAGGEQSPGHLILLDAAGKPTASLAAAGARLDVGGLGANGTVSVHLSDGKPGVELLAQNQECTIGAGQKGRPGRLTMYDGNGAPTVNVTAGNGRLDLGGSGVNGAVSVHLSNGSPAVELLALPEESVIGAGQQGRPGRLTMYDGNGRPTVNLTTADACLEAGGGGVDGHVVLLGAEGKGGAELRVYPGVAALGLGGQERSGLINLFHAGNNTLTCSAAAGRIDLGGGGVNGTISVHLAGGDPGVELLVLNQECIIGAGQQGRPGRLTLYDGNGSATVNLATANGRLDLGGGGVNGTVSVHLAGGDPGVELLVLDQECVIGAGQQGRPGRLTLYDGNGSANAELRAADAVLAVGSSNRDGVISVFSANGESVRIDGTAGDILLMNADCAEEFDVAGPGVEPGTVMVLTDEGGLAPSCEPYDTRVAGVVSGAGSTRPGLILDRRPGQPGRLPVALMGKVFCQVDASATPVRVGDLLTTGCLPGCAMRATDPQRAFGAVLGKALAPLARGCALIPVLVTLQ